MAMREMTSRQRFLAVLHGDMPDRVPATVHQWQVYHLRHYMHLEDDLEAFRHCGLDAVIYPSWPASVQNENWQISREQSDRGDGSLEIRLEINTPGGRLTQKSVGTDYTLSLIHI